MDYRTLAKRALVARTFSYSPYSRFRVGAALLSKSGKVFTGCNVESSSYGLTICAERTALFKAVSEGHKKFKAIAIASDENGFTSPCGACRQVIFDLAGNIDIILTKKNGETRVIKMDELLPHAFSKKNLKSLKRKK
jgi:cytidine deaminase